MSTSTFSPTPLLRSEAVRINPTVAADPAAPPLGAPDSEILIRKLTAWDRREFERFLVSLDADTRHDRFFGGESDASVARYANRAWRDDAVVIGAFAGARLCGVAELCGTSDADSPEAAFVVAPEFRGRGIGTGLLDRVILSAGNQGYPSVLVVCLRTNRPMRKLAVKAQAKLDVSYDEVSGKILLPPRTLATRAEEHLADLIGGSRLRLT